MDLNDFITVWIGVFVLFGLVFLITGEFIVNMIIIWKERLKENENKS